jgi:hypothetical protein
MQIIQNALESSSADERMELLRAKTSTGSINPGSLAFTVARMIQDFEGDDEEAAVEIADRVLLARLCLLREELRQLADESEMTPWKKTTTGSSTSSEVDVEVMVDGENEYKSINTNDDGGATASSTAAPSAGASPYTALRGVPAREVSFLKELISVASSEKRRSVLEAAFKGTTQPISGGSRGENSSTTSTGLIRPGAFMDCIKALQTEMLGPQYGIDANQATLLRLEEVWRESVIVLEDIAGDSNYMP